MITERLNQTIDIWIYALAQYNFAKLCAKPSPESWSLGQVYMHLLDTTGYFILQARTCAATNVNADENSSAAARKMFLMNDFPEQIIEGPPSNASTPQAQTKEELLHALLNLKKEAITVGGLVLRSPFKGKTRHPGLNYFNAMEWLQFADMHLRHHLRQKRRIDEFLLVNDK
jgi:hypothetical protein